jgi:hypothetical protein
MYGTGFLNNGETIVMESDYDYKDLATQHAHTGMKVVVVHGLPVTLNLGLNGSNHLLPMQRLMLYRAFLATCMSGAAGFVHTDAEEQTLVVSGRFATNTVGGVKACLQWLDTMLDVTGQDCMALTVAPSHYGPKGLQLLYGPRADKWRPFDPSKFIEFPSVKESFNVKLH